MKGIIYYYSSTGNTKLACRYIARNSQIPFDLVDVTKDQVGGDLEPYDVVGFATFTDFGGPPYLFQTFMEGLPRQEGKLAFVFNTYGMISLKTLRILQKTATTKGFNVIAGYSLHTPESYPPAIADGNGAAGAPEEAALRDFDAFISELGRLFESAEEGTGVIKGQRIRVGLLGTFVPSIPRTKARDDMGEKYVDASLCTECGTCAKGCPYAAIRLEPKPVFDMDKCYGCWRCYHRCPTHAIYTKKFRGEPYYPRPNEQLKKKLLV